MPATRRRRRRRPRSRTSPSSSTCTWPGEPAADYDTAFSAGASTLAALAQIADPQKILFVTDSPMAPLTAISHFGEQFDTRPLAVLDRGAIFRGNAARLLRR